MNSQNSETTPTKSTSYRERAALLRQSLADSESQLFDSYQYRNEIVWSLYASYASTTQEARSRRHPAVARLALPDDQIAELADTIRDIGYTHNYLRTQTVMGEVGSRHFLVMLAMAVAATAGVCWGRILSLLHGSPTPVVDSLVVAGVFLLALVISFLVVGYGDDLQYQAVRRRFLLLPLEERLRRLERYLEPPSRTAETQPTNTVQCPCCEKPVSPRAVSCPYCGEPFSPATTSHNSRQFGAGWSFGHGFWARFGERFADVLPALLFIGFVIAFVIMTLWYLTRQ
jgi:uncharacterized membrane protein YciS (DUF1049 family)